SAESRRVGEIKEFTPELQPHALVDGKIAHSDEVPVLEAPAIKDVAAAVAECERLGHTECRRVEVARQSAGVDGAGCDAVRTQTGAGVGRIRSDRRSKGQPALDGENASELPILHQL